VRVVGRAECKQSRRKETILAFEFVRVVARADCKQSGRKATILAKHVLHMLL